MRFYFIPQALALRVNLNNSKQNNKIQPHYTNYQHNTFRIILI